MTEMQKGLIVRQPWIDLILDRMKPWEIRGSNTSVRGRIWLIQSGTKHIVGQASLVDSFPLTQLKFEMNRHFHRVPETFPIRYPRMFAWVLQDARRFDAPIPYRHPPGAVIWVNLPIGEGIYDELLLLRD